MMAPNCREFTKSQATLSKRATRSTALRDRRSSNRLKVRTMSLRLTSGSRRSRSHDPVMKPVLLAIILRQLTCRGSCILALLALALCWSIEARAANKKIVLVAGHPSHGPGDHEFNAGVQLLHKCLEHQSGVSSTFHLNGWPNDPHAFDGADTIMFFMDGGGGHPIIQDDHLKIDRKSVV